jgi:hypothetical protein
MPERNRENDMSIAGGAYRGNEYGGGWWLFVDTVIRTRIRRRCGMLRWDFCLWKRVVEGKEGKRSPRHRRDMNVNLVWSGWTCVGCGRSDTGKG